LRSCSRPSIGGVRWRIRDWFTRPQRKRSGSRTSRERLPRRFREADADPRLDLYRSIVEIGREWFLIAVVYCVGTIGHVAIVAETSFDFPTWFWIALAAFAFVVAQFRVIYKHQRELRRTEALEERFVANERKLSAYQTADALERLKAHVPQPDPISALRKALAEQAPEDKRRAELVKYLSETLAEGHRIRNRAQNAADRSELGEACAAFSAWAIKTDARVLDNAAEYYADLHNVRAPWALGGRENVLGAMDERLRTQSEIAKKLGA
jgi:hypothetical protein